MIFTFGREYGISEERELCLVLRIFKFHETWNSTREPKLELARIRLLKILKSLSKIAWKIIGASWSPIYAKQCNASGRVNASFPSRSFKSSLALVKKKIAPILLHHAFIPVVHAAWFLPPKRILRSSLFDAYVSTFSFVRSFLFEVFIASFYSWNSSIYFEYSLVRFIFFFFLVLLERI